MKIVNQTKYSTRTLRKLITRIAKDELTPEKASRTVIRIIYWRGNWTGGCATIGGLYATIKMPHPKHKLDMPAMAKTIAHEMAHLRGLRHGADMHCGRYSWHHGDYRTFYAWAEEYRPEHKAEPPKPAKGVVVAGKLQHAMNMLARNATKLKRAQTLVKKWQAKVRYYQKKAEEK